MSTQNIEQLETRPGYLVRHFIEMSVEIPTNFLQEVYCSGMYGEAQRYILLGVVLVLWFCVHETA